jgi:hypothetical protein
MLCAALESRRSEAVDDSELFVGGQVGVDLAAGAYVPVALSRQADGDARSVGVGDPDGHGRGLDSDARGMYGDFRQGMDYDAPGGRVVDHNGSVAGRSQTNEARAPGVVNDASMVRPRDRSVRGAVPRDHSGRAAMPVCGCRRSRRTLAEGSREYCCRHDHRYQSLSHHRRTLSLMFAFYL